MRTERTAENAVSFTVKTFNDWQGSGQELTPYLNPGDPVDAAFADWALNLLPPAYWSERIVQIGEPHSHIAGKPTFATFYKDAGEWFFAGYCYRGRIAEP